MSKRILSLMLVVVMLLSYTVVFADTKPTMTIEDFDASEIADKTVFEIPVKLDKGTMFNYVTGFQVDLEFDGTILQMATPATSVLPWKSTVKDEFGDELPPERSTTPISLSYSSVQTSTPYTATIGWTDTTGKDGLVIDAEGLELVSDVIFTLKLRKREGVTAGDVANTTVTIASIKVLGGNAFGENTPYTVAEGTMNGPTSFDIQLKEAAPAVSVTWTKAVETIDTAARFLFDADVKGGEVAASGVKFVKADNFTEDIAGALTGTAATFYADLTDIPAEADKAAYYAAAYVKIGDDYNWYIVNLNGEVQE